VFRRQRYVAVFFVAFTLFLAFVVYRVFATWQEMRIREVFVSMAADQGLALRQSISRNIEIMHSIRDLYSASREVERDEFRAFTEEPLRRHPDFRAFEWIPRVSRDERSDFEARTRAEGLDGFVIWEQDSEGRRVPVGSATPEASATPAASATLAGSRGEVYPVYFIEPFAGNETVAGFDLASDPSRSAALEAARDANRVEITAPLTIVQSSESAVIMTLPVYMKNGPHDTLEERRERLQGFVLGVLQVNRMGESVMRSLRPRGIEMRVLDVTDPEAVTVLFEPRLFPAAIRARDVSRVLPIGAAMKFEWSSRLDVGGRTWKLVVWPTDRFIERHRDFTGELILVGGMLFALLLGVYLWSSIRRAEEIESLIGDLSVEVAERRRTEEALRVAAEEARTSAEEARLLNERLQELDRLKSEFLATVSHELRTPVATIRGAVENQLHGIGGAISDMQRRQLEIVSRSTARLGRLIENLLDMTRLEAGRFSVSFRPMDLCSALRHAVESVRSLAARAGIIVDLELPDAPLSMTADHDRVIQVTINLLDNAMRFASSRVVVSARARGNDAEIRVEDDGPGIPSGEGERIFERFTTRDAIGTKSHMGLGLSIVRAIVEAHGGTVRLEHPGVNGGAADWGGGAVFVVSLPRERREDERSGQPTGY
jgi:signal transduction histidine kinase